MYQAERVRRQELHQAEDLELVRDDEKDLAARHVVVLVLARGFLESIRVSGPGSNEHASTYGGIYLRINSRETSEPQGS